MANHESGTHCGKAFSKLEQLRRTDENRVRRMLIKDEEIRGAFLGLLIRQFLIEWLANHCSNHVPSEGFGE